MTDAIINQLGSLKKNTSTDPRQMRRIIAEDPDWNLATVPHLIEICLKYIVENFAAKPILHDLLPRHKKYVLSNLSVNIPLSITANLIVDEGYWQKCCKVRWEVCDISSFGNSWKRMFFERNLQEQIENFVPETTDINTILDTLKLSEHYVRCLKIGQLLPPIKLPQVLTEDDLSDSESDVDDSPLIDHFDFNVATPLLPQLEELHLTYGVRNCGMNFEWNLFEFTNKDCTLLAKAVKSCRTLKAFHLLNSKVDDNKARTLISHMLDHPSLELLDFSYNKLSNSSARAIGKLLSGHSKLVTLELEDNHISAQGAGAIAHALKKNTTLKKLSLRLNQLGDEGCQHMCQALLVNTTLELLHVGSNNFTETSAPIIGQVLIYNKSLVSFNLSCNPLTERGGKTLQEGMEDNGTITHMDLRLTDIGQECEYNISQLLKKNRDEKRKAAMK